MKIEIGTLPKYLFSFFIILATLFVLASWPIVKDSSTICGQPPPVTNDNLRGEIDNKLLNIARLMGIGNFSAEIQSTRREIFSKYKNERQWSDAYMEYQLCVIIMNANDMTSGQKIEELQKNRIQFSKPIASKEKQEVLNSAHKNIFNVKEIDRNNIEDLLSLDPNIRITRTQEYLKDLIRYEQEITNIYLKVSPFIGIEEDKLVQSAKEKYIAGQNEIVLLITGKKEGDFNTSAFANDLLVYTETMIKVITEEYRSSIL